MNKITSTLQGSVHESDDKFKVKQYKCQLARLNFDFTDN